MLGFFSLDVVVRLLIFYILFLVFCGWGGKGGSMSAAFVLFVSRFILNKSKKITNRDILFELFHH